MPTIKTGVFWGTFDPPTRAHQSIIQKVIVELGIEKLYIVVNNDQRKSPIANISQRVDMLQKMTLQYHDSICIQPQNAHNEDYFVFRAHLKCPLAVIAGADSLLWILTRYSIDFLSQYDRVCIFTRDNASIPPDCPVETIELDAQTRKISSKTARFSLRYKATYVPALPKTVSDYIQKHRLYTQTQSSPIEPHIHQALNDPYFNQRVAGQACLLLMQNTHTLLRIAPHRFKNADKEPISKKNNCVFDNIEQTHPHAVAWHDYFLIANKYPYLNHHGLFISRAHVEQSMMQESSYLQKTLELHRSCPALFFFFNHYAGNSQAHFHIHFTSEPFPLTMDIQEACTHRTTNSITPFVFQPWQKGLLWYGDASFICETLPQQLQRMQQQGRLYNLLFFPFLESKKHILALIERTQHLDDIYVRGDGWKMAISASDLAGVFTIKSPCAFEQDTQRLHLIGRQKATIPIHQLDDALSQAYKKTVVDITKNTKL